MAIYKLDGSYIDIPYFTLQLLCFSDDTSQSIDKIISLWYNPLFMIDEFPFLEDDSVKELLLAILVLKLSVVMAIEIILK